MAKEKINYKPLISKYLADAEKYFPPDWSYNKNTLFRDYASEIILNCIEEKENTDLAQIQQEFIVQKVCNWCAWNYIDSESLYLNDIYLEKMFQTITKQLIDSFFNCIRKHCTLEECDEILDAIAKDCFDKLIDSFLSKGIIDKNQALKARLHNAKDLSVSNIELNKENNKNLSKILIIGTLCFIVIPLIFALTTESNIIATLAVTITLALICYWLYMIILNWRTSKTQIDLLIIKGGTATNPTAGSSSSNSKNKVKGNTNNSQLLKPLDSGKDTKGLVSSRGIRSFVLLKLGKNIMPYSIGYTEGQLPVLVGKLRNKLIKKYNFELPPIEIQDDRQLGDNEYRIIIRRSKIYEDCKGIINFQTEKPNESVIEPLVAQIEVCIEKHIEKLKNWSFAKGTKPEDFSGDI